jgi:hypothetical protein
MKILAVIFLICLMLAGTVSAKAAPSSAASSIVNPAINPGIFVPVAYTPCSADSASVDTPPSSGDLNADSIPGGASITIDGSPWTYIYCTSGFPPVCFHLPVFTPYTGAVTTGSHTITISLSGYKSYSGTVDICSQKVSYVHQTLSAITTTVPTTTGPTTVTTTTAAVTTTVTTVPVTTTAVPTTAIPVATSSVPAATSPAVVGSVPPGSGSLSVTTTPAGASVSIDGVQRGISPTTIPGLAAGSHTVLLKLSGYQDLSAPVSVTAGAVNSFSTGLTPLPAEITTVPATTAAGAAALPARTRSPGFEGAFGIAALGAILCLRAGSRR